MLDPLGVHIHPLRENATKSLHFAAQVVELGVEAHSTLAKVYGGQGPFATAITSPNPEAIRARSALRSCACSVGTRTARDTATLALVHVSCQTRGRSIASSAMSRSTSDSARARRASREANSARRASMYRRPGPAVSRTTSVAAGSRQGSAS